MDGNRRKLDRHDRRAVLQTRVLRSRRMQYRTLFLLGSILAAAVAAACGQKQPESSPAAPGTTGDAQAGSSTSSEGGSSQAAVDAGPQVMIGALFMQTPIMSEMDWPTKNDDDPNPKKHRKDKTVKRIGYLRQGGLAPVIPEPHKTANCQEGWYELVAGGFVCGKYATLDLTHPRIKTAPHAPYLDQGLPYQYATNVANGTPLYRTIPSKDDRLRFEPWYQKKTKPKIEESNPYDPTFVSTTTDPPPAATIAPSTSDPMGLGVDDLDAGTPWYLRDWDGGKPQVTLDDLRGEGPIVRRMVKGFYVAIDQAIDVNHIKWWKTTASYIAPYDRMYVTKPITDFHGVWLNTAAATAAPFPGPVAQDAGATPPYWVEHPPTHLPMAFVSWPRSHKYTLDTDHKHATEAADTVSRYTPLQLTGTKETVGGVVYHEVEGGTWVRGVDVVVMEPGPAPTDLQPGEKWIDVNLTTQSLLAFEGDKAVYATLVSTGRKDKNNKDKNHETPPGTFRIREKHIASTMDGDVATDGPYSIEDVPWIMYFNMSYALHGAFWHNNFGHQQSHGCVNLAPNDARALFGWTEPRLPEGWHGVWATDEHPGTRVIVHGDSLPK
jgi:lipoprotein-anchoring transpeptidase ErfK/SrfK